MNKSELKRLLRKIKQIEDKILLQIPNLKKDEYDDNKPECRFAKVSYHYLTELALIKIRIEKKEDNKNEQGTDIQADKGAESDTAAEKPV